MFKNSLIKMLDLQKKFKSWNQRKLTIYFVQLCPFLMQNVCTAHVSFIKETLGFLFWMIISFFSTSAFQWGFSGTIPTVALYGSGANFQDA